METEKVVISVRPDRREGALVGYSLQAIKPGVGDRVEGYLEVSKFVMWSLGSFGGLKGALNELARPPDLRLGAAPSRSWRVRS